MCITRGTYEQKRYKDSLMFSSVQKKNNDELIKRHESVLMCPSGEDSNILIRIDGMH